jgi:DNA helicase HerA-like ATPase
MAYFVGKINQHNFFWNPDKEHNPHLVVCGSSGSGKTYTIKNIISSLSKKGITFTVLDKHGDIYDERMSHTTCSVDNSTIETDEKLRTYSLLLGLDYLQRVTKGFNIYGNIEIGKVLSSKIKVDDETYKTDKKLNYKVEFGMDFARRWNVGLFYERKEYGKVRDIGESIPRQDYMGVKIGFNFM